LNGQPHRAPARWAAMTQPFPIAAANGELLLNVRAAVFANVRSSAWSQGPLLAQS